MAYSGFTSGTNYLVTTGTPITGYPCSISAWVKKSRSVAANTRIVDIANSSVNTTAFRLFIVSTNVIRGTEINTGSGVNTDTTELHPDNEWEVLTVCFHSVDNRDVYISNRGVKSVTVNNFLPSGLTRIGVGGGGGSVVGTAALNGSLAHVAIWNEGLSTDDVTNLASGISPLFVRAAALRTYWPLESNFQDMVGGYDLVLTGSLTRVDGPDIFMDQGLLYEKNEFLKSTTFTLDFSLVDAIETEWTFFLSGSSFVVRTNLSGVTSYANILSSSIRHVELQLPFGVPVSIRVRQRTSYGWQRSTLIDSDLMSPAFNSYQRFLELSSLASTVSTEKSSNLTPSGTIETTRPTKLS